MSYCTISDVTSIVDTDMSNTEVDVLIDIVSAFMTGMLDTGAATSQMLRGIAQLWTAYRVMLKDPNARRIGEYSEDRAIQLKLMWDQVQYMILRAEGGITFIATREELS